MIFFISIIIPCRNEEKFIGKCLNSLLNNDYPKENLEILVIDGASEDKTRKIVKDYSEKYSLIKLLENPQKYTPFALNIGINNAKGDIIMRADSHASYERDYISKCVRYLRDYNANNVGGIWKIEPRENTLIGKAIALSLSHPFGSGDAFYKTELVREPKWVDTVPFGCYKKEIFKEIGLFNENLIRSQDMEFNTRLKNKGGRILLVPDIISYYYARSNLKEFFLHTIKDGIWAILPLKFVKIPFGLRHYLPLLFVGSLLVFLILSFFWPVFSTPLFIILGFYILAGLFFSVRIAFREKDWKLFFALPIAFAARHFAYGLGSLWGMIKLMTNDQ